MNESVEAVVVGGGVTGCSIAYHLAKEGVKVALIERGELASGTSSACFGGLTAQVLELPLSDLVVESLKLYPNLSEELQYNFGYERCGTYICLDKEDQWPTIRKRAEKLHEQGVEVSLEEGDMRRFEPALSESVIGASICPEDACINPMRLCFGFASAAERMGAKIHTFTELRSIGVIGGEIRSALTNRGKIKTDFIVNAAGAWAPLVGEMVGLKIPVSPMRGQVVVTEPLPLFRWRYIMEAALITENLLHPTDRRLGIALSLLQYKEGNFLVGVSADFPGYDRRTTPEIVKLILKRAIRFVPQLKNFSFIRTYAGLRPYPDDGNSILGEVEGVKGFVLASGQGGHGNILSPITGKLISELITKGKTSIPIDEYNYSRFKQSNHSNDDA